MWFSMPKGCGGITVERQEFSVEAKDDKGVGYFRAPDHFAPRILSLGAGFAMATPPEGAPADLPKDDPLRDGAIVELTKVSEAQKIEIQDLRADLIAATSRVTAFNNENTELKTKLMAKEKEIEELREQLEDKDLATKVVKK